MSVEPEDLVGPASGPPVRVSIDGVDTDAVREILKAADIIFITDPKVNFWKQLFGQHSVAHVRPFGSRPYQIKQVEIEVDSTSATHLEKAKAAIVAAKGTPIE
jgi:hypothetical protein